MRDFEDVAMANNALKPALALLAVLVLAACAQEQPDSATLKVDGKIMAFHDAHLVVHGVGGKHEAFSLIAYEQAPAQGSSFDIHLQLPGAVFRVGKYSAQELSTHGKRPGVGQSDALSLQFIPRDPKGTGKPYWSQSGRRGDVGNFVLEITSLTDTRMSARFAGPLDDIDDRVIQVSGQFSLPYESVSQAGW